ncbi:hypothetical protein ABE10_27980, partial [Bacillus toyonensis]|nr:hypothetical protein [Bacillus toyonensis]
MEGSPPSARFSHPRPRFRTSPGTVDRASLAEHTGEIAVPETTFGVHPLPQREEVAEPRIAVCELLMAKGVKLPPVRSATVLAHDALDRIEVRAGVVSPIAVHRDVRRLASVSGREPTVVGGGEAHLDRKLDPPSAPRDELPDRVECGHDLRGRDRVLHLAEPHGAALREDTMREVGVLTITREADGEPAERRRDRRHHGSRRTHRPVDAVGEQRLVDPLPHDRKRTARRGGGQALGALRESHIGVREPVELEVVGHRRAFMDVCEEFLQRHRPVDLVHHERGDALEGDLHHHAEGAETQGDCGQELGLVPLVDPQELPCGGDERDTGHLRGETAEPRPCAMGAGRDRPGDRLPVDVAEVLHRESIRREK